MSTDYQALAKKLMARAKKKGAQQAEVFIEVGREASVRVRDGEIEDLTQATSKGVGVRVFVKKRLGFAWTSDFTWHRVQSDRTRSARQCYALASAGTPAAPPRSATAPASQATTRHIIFWTTPAANRSWRRT